MQKHRLTVVVLPCHCALDYISQCPSLIHLSFFSPSLPPTSFTSSSSPFPITHFFLFLSLPPFLRGGGERGLGWHRAGRLEGKQRGVEDLGACIQRLHNLGVSTPGRTALTARSAGAVLVGALCNQQPQLIRAVTVQVRKHK